jgi:hypothetical protein
VRATSPTRRPTGRHHPAIIVRLALALLVATTLGLATAGSSPAGATTPPDETLLTLPPDDQPVTTDNEFLDLERDLSDCVGNALPKPGCGREPTHSGDRGGVMQWSVFGVMILGIGFIGWRIIAGARRNRRPSPV